LIVVAAIAHNIATKRNEPLLLDQPGDDSNSDPEDEEDFDSFPDDVERATQNVIRIRGQAFRDRVVQNYF
jgi:hypothetical protein